MMFQNRHLRPARADPIGCCRNLPGIRRVVSGRSITNTVRYTAMSPERFKDIWRD
jgi:hypothetical protein